MTSCQLLLGSGLRKPRQVAVSRWVQGRKVDSSGEHPIYYHNVAGSLIMFEIALG